MYVIKLKTVVFYFLVLAIIFAGISGIIHMKNSDKNTDDRIYAKYVMSENKIDTDANNIVKLPILMYHSLCDNNDKQSRFVISRGEFEKDLKYLADNGYTTVSAGELADYLKRNGKLPQKPILLTFDDGYYNNYCYGFSLLKKYNAKAVISIIGKYTDIYSDGEKESPVYSHITWSECKEMTESGLVEIENHSYDSHTITKARNGTKKNAGESNWAYKQYIKTDIGKLQEKISENLGYTPKLFAYPFGSVCEASFDILKEIGFEITLSCEEKINYIDKQNADSLFMLGRYLRTPERSAENILNDIQID